MNFSAHLGAQGGIDELMSGDLSFAGELRRHDSGRVVCIVVRLNQYLGAGQSGGDQGLDFDWIHRWKACGAIVATKWLLILSEGRGARGVGKKNESNVSV